jgi:hypothetical protein
MKLILSFYTFSKCLMTEFGLLRKLALESMNNEMINFTNAASYTSLLIHHFTSTFCNNTTLLWSLAIVVRPRHYLV